MSVAKHLLCPPYKSHTKRLHISAMHSLTPLLLSFSITALGCSAPIDSVAPGEQPGPGLSVRHTRRSGEPFQKRARAEDGSEALEPHYYYDGELRREVWMDPTRLLELRPDDAGSATVQQLYSAAARPGVTTRFHRIWELEGARSDDAAVLLGSGDPDGRFTPLFQPAPNGTGSGLGLPGGIIVVLDPEWNRSQVTSWLASEDLVHLRDLPLAPNALLVASRPGLPGLQRANALFESGTVLRAQPNWWREMAAR